MSLLFPAYNGQTGQKKEGVAGFGTSLMIHLVIVAIAVLGFAHSDKLEELAKPLAVSLLEAPRSQPERLQPVLPPNVKAPPQKQPMPVATEVATIPLAAPTGAPAAPVAVSAPAVPQDGAITEAKFDADYLSNPKPPYPTASRRLGETGTVYLRVHVSADGHAVHVEVKKSSGFARLDQSAQETVARWKFVPAKKGNNPVTSWVVVPIVFSLT